MRGIRGGEMGNGEGMRRWKEGQGLKLAGFFFLLRWEKLELSFACL